jgi:hypothetical protein
MHTLDETYVITGRYTDEDDDGSYDDSASNTVFKLHINYSILVNEKRMRGNYRKHVSRAHFVQALFATL